MPDATPPHEHQPTEAELLSAAHPDLTREHYVPMATSTLSERLYAVLPPGDQRHWKSLVRLFSATIHHGLWERHHTLQTDYAPFDPDCDHPARDPLSPEAENALSERLFRDARHLLARANFVQLEAEDIDEALSAASDWGVSLKMDTSSFERLEVFARGDTITRRKRSSWRTLYRDRWFDVPTYLRLAVLFRLRDGVDASLHHGPDAHHATPANDVRPIFVKLFKNVPKMDVDMLLPGAKVKMTWVDRGKIMLPTLSGLGLAAIKIAKGAVLFTFVSVYGTLALVGFVGGTLAYGVKSFFGYLQTKDKYHLHLTRSLYYQNLDNNAGVFTRLLLEAEQQDLREALLAYVMLRVHAGPGGWTAHELDQKVEEWLQRELNMLIDFEVHDALAKLTTWKLITKLGAGRYIAIPAEQACHLLDAQWDAWFTMPEQEPSNERVA